MPCSKWHICTLCCTVSLQCPDIYTLNSDRCECKTVINSQCPTNARTENTTAPCTCGIVFEPMCLPGWDLKNNSCSCHPRPKPTCPHSSQLAGNCSCSGSNEPVCVLGAKLNTTDCTCHVDIPRFCLIGKVTSDSCSCELKQDPTCDSDLSLNKPTCGCI